MQNRVLDNDVVVQLVPAFDILDERVGRSGAGRERVIELAQKRHRRWTDEFFLEICFQEVGHVRQMLFEVCNWERSELVADFLAKSCFGPLATIFQKRNKQLIKPLPQRTHDARGGFRGGRHVCKLCTCVKSYFFLFFNESQQFFSNKESVAGKET